MRDLDYSYDIDSEETDSLVIYIYDVETEEIVDSCGGFGADFEVSDHGNIILSAEGKRYIRDNAMMMISDILYPATEEG